MADQLLQQAQDLFEGQIVSYLSLFFGRPLIEGCQDFEGQKLTELFSTIILVLTGVRLPRSLLPFR